jgi:REP element-mobilizing transposase RayT
MGKHIHKSGTSRKEWYDGAHKFEHWYVDRSVYHITSRVRGKLSVFTTAETCSIFWTKFEQYAGENTFEPWIVTLMSNHYHVVGYLEQGNKLGQMMRKFHGSVAWMACKSLGISHKPFWRDDEHRDYFDGCLRDEIQLTRSYRYVLTQAQRAGIVPRNDTYPNTRSYVSMEEALRRASERNALLKGVPYARYDNPGRKRGRKVDPS